MMVCNLRVKIQYKLNYEKIWKEIKLLPQEYFDLDENEIPETESIPLFNNAIDYINDDNQAIVSTKIVILDEHAKKKRTIATYYWNDRQNMVIERIDHDGDNCENEIIIETKIQDDPPTYEVMRIIRNDLLTPIYHGFISDKDDGSQTENRVL